MASLHKTRRELMRHRQLWEQNKKAQHELKI
jgi:hypothetical protein